MSAKSKTKHFIQVHCVFMILAVITLRSHGQNLPGENTIIKVYKTIDTTKLSMDLIYPANFEKNKKFPAMIFFFGGGWSGGTIEQFRPHALYFSSRGMITVLANYRVSSRNKTTPFEAVKDARSAIRYLRKNAEALAIDTGCIVASGGSAGGHLAAATGNIPGPQEAGEDISVSSKPNALVLFNPVFDNGPDGYGFDRVGGESHYREISPIHNIRQGAPPTIIFLGTKDPLIPVATAELYKKRMLDVGSRCELFLYPDQKHGFFNVANPEYYQKTVYEADVFLNTLGYIAGKPTIIK